LSDGVSALNRYPDVFTEADHLPAGEVVLNFKLKAHPLVAYKFYPSLFPKFHPDGLPAKYANAVH
jgi:hypothetical protein